VTRRPFNAEDVRRGRCCLCADCLAADPSRRVLLAEATSAVRRNTNLIPKSGGEE